MKALLLLVATLLPLSLAQTPTLPDGYRAEALVTGLRGPTQMTFGPDGRFYVAQLAGGENSGTGEVLRVDLATGKQEILLRARSRPARPAEQRALGGYPDPDAGRGASLRNERRVRAERPASGFGYVVAARPRRPG